MKVPQVKPDWETGIYIGNGVVAKPEPTEAPTEYQVVGLGERICETFETVAELEAFMAYHGKEHNGYFERDIRDDGTYIQREILEGAPKFKGMCGPMGNGDGLRYETWEIYDIMSR